MRGIEQEMTTKSRKSWHRAFGRAFRTGACIAAGLGVTAAASAWEAPRGRAADCTTAAGLAAPPVKAGELMERVVLDITVSATTAVAEPDWLEVLEARVQEADRLGLFARETQAARSRMARHARRPVQLPLARSTKASTHSVELLSQDQWIALTDVQVQALQHLHRAYLFVDGADAAQLKWLTSAWPAIRRERMGGEPLRVVAVGGDLTEVTRASGGRVWADQGARLTRAFALTAVPALAVVRPVLQDGQPAGVSAVVDTFAAADDSENAPASEPTARAASEGGVR